MSYENPPIPEGINVGRENPLLEFARLAAGLAIVLAAISALLYFAGGTLARRIPFSTERDWVGDRLLGIRAGQAAEATPSTLENYLQELILRVAGAMDLPADMQVQAHYVASDVPNAFASLGGHIAVTRGLYERMTSENALALVLAHEVAHVRARDPIAALGGGAAMMVVVTWITGNTGSLASAFAGVVQRGYSRSAEARADEAAVAALRKLYGHAGGGSEVFEKLAAYREQHGMEMPSLLSTHPLDADRIARLRQAAASWNPSTQPLQPLRVASE